MDDLLRDVRLALRRLARHPGFSAVAVLTLAVGIGATTLVFSTVNAVLLKPLPFASSDRLVSISSGHFQGVSYLDFQDFQSLQVFSGVVIYSTRTAVMTGSGDPAEIHVVAFAGDPATVFAQGPEIGRLFDPPEIRSPVVLISHALWVSRFGRSSDVLGRVVSLDGVPHTIIGVLPPGFGFPNSAVHAWTPIGGILDAQPRAMTSRGYRLFDCIARMGPGVTAASARAHLATLFHRVLAEVSGPDSGQALAQLTRGTAFDAGYEMVPLRENVVGPNAGPALLLLSGAVVLVLLIACANVANLLMARAVARRREISVLQALGATRPRLFRQFVVEGVVLALAAAAVGSISAAGGLRVILGTWPDVLPRAAEISIDLPTLLFATGLALVTGATFGSIPTFVGAPTSLETALRSEAGGSSGRRRRAQGALVVTQVAVAVVLLVGATLLIRSFIHLMAVDSGFDTHDILATRIRLNPGRYLTPARQLAFFDQVLAELRENRDIGGAAVTSTLPLASDPRIAAFDPRLVQPDDPPILIALSSSVTPQYFTTLGLPLRRGRPFGPQDQLGSPRVVIINQALATDLWPGADPIGKTIPLDNLRDGIGRPALVVGVVGNVKMESLEERSPANLVFTPAAQDSGLPAAWLILRSRAGRPLSLVAAATTAIRRVDPMQPITEEVTFSQVLARDTAARRLNTALLAVFAALAVLLAMIGVYSLTAYAVSQRTRELGIRMALGAGRRDVLALLLRESAWRVGGGVAAGVLVAPLSARLISASLFGLGASDPLTLLFASCLLMLVGLFATYVPARRATSIDPTQSLRQE